MMALCLSVPRLRGPEHLAVTAIQSGKLCVCVCACARSDSGRERKLDQRENDWLIRHQN